MSVPSPPTAARPPPLHHSLSALAELAAATATSGERLARAKRPRSASVREPGAAAAAAASPDLHTYNSVTAPSTSVRIGAAQPYAACTACAAGGGGGGGGGGPVYHVVVAEGARLALTVAAGCVRVHGDVAQLTTHGGANVSVRGSIAVQTGGSGLTINRF